MKIALFFVLAMAFLSAGVQAQTRYVCTINGTTYQSTRPCPGGGNITTYGPSASRPSPEPRVPRIGQAPANLKYLSPRCASLNDALRTAQARGLKYDTIARMQQEYRQECAESEREANALMSQERRDDRDRLNEARKAQALNKERTQLQQQQCDESKRILFKKRARTDLSDGEKADLRRFEENYRSRCG
ncbi:MAG: hypothetical protein KIT63_22235 [Rhodoferax sp.]|nr:hypothetical protein [Rhodoferax sp.]